MWRLCLIVGSLLLALSSYALCQATNEGDQNGDQYGVILDAGSSGTKLKVYKWQKTTLVTDIPSMDLILRQHKTTPGIEQFARQPEGLQNYLEKIMEKAKKIVPNNMRASTPVYLMATAGVRILEGNMALGLFNRIRNVLSNKTINPFWFNGKNVRILSGEEEAVFAWVAVNALSGFFNSSRPATESMGLLEMGGGSTQIAFVPSEPLYAGEFQVFIGGRRYDLYAHSYLFFGANYIKHRLNRYLENLNKEATDIYSPCRLKGDNKTEASKSGTKLTFRGESNPVECENILQTFLARATGDRCHPKPCAIGSVYQPNIGNTSFYATQSFIYTPQTMRALGPHKRLNITQLREEANKYCSKTYNEVMSQYTVSEKYASGECLMGIYLPMLLLDAYRFDPELTSVTVTNKIHKEKIDWTRGAMLYELNMMFQSKRLMPETRIPCVPIENNDYVQPYNPVTERAPAKIKGSGNTSYKASLLTIYACITAVLIGTVV